MEPDRKLFTVFKSESEKTDIIIHNVLTMLGNRIYIDKDGEKQRLLDPEKALETMKEEGDHTYIIKANNKDQFVLKIVFQKIITAGKQSIINDFLGEYADYKKIIVALDYNNKIVEYVNRHQTQIFKEATFLQDIIKYRDQPIFELLSPKEMEKFKEEYNATDYTTKKMVRTDPIAKYYALKRGDIIRIIRPSPTSGEAIDYRIVM